MRSQAEPVAEQIGDYDVCSIDANGIAGDIQLGLASEAVIDIHRDDLDVA